MEEIAFYLCSAHAFSFDQYFNLLGLSALVTGLHAYIKTNSVQIIFKRFFVCYTPTLFKVGGHIHLALSACSSARHHF